MNLLIRLKDSHFTSHLLYTKAAAHPISQINIMAYAACSACIGDLLVRQYYAACKLVRPAVSHWGERSKPHTCG